NDILVEMTDPDTGEKTYELRRNIFPDYAALMESGKIPNATNGVVFGIELVRNNGVVTDELLFMYTSPSTLSTTLQENLNAVVAIEERNFASANTIRAIYASIATKGDMSFMFVDEVVDTNNDGETDKVENTFWVPGVVSNGVSHTFPGANIFSFDATYKQPRLSYTYSLPSYLRLSANVTGDDENGLGITTMKSTVPKAKVRFTRVSENNEELFIDDGSFKRSVTHSQMTKGTNYTLRLTPVIKEWFDYSIKCNNSPITPVKEETITFTDETTNELWTLPCYTIVEGKQLLEDSDYKIELELTKKAKDLKGHDQFSKAENVNYEAWLLKSGTIAQLAATLEADDVSFAEKFWLGFGSALDSGENVDLNFSYIGTILGPDGVTTSPSLAVRLQNGTTPINELKSDGVLVLCGKVNLSDDAWTYITTINPKDVNLDAEEHFKYLQPATDCKIFKVILVSEADAKALKNATP
ncbi:MAG: hypothetical protein Q4C03_00970, partial [bacterium]|nr:hypothetical protein [bacterium]